MFAVLMNLGFGASVAGTPPSGDPLNTLVFDTIIDNKTVFQLDNPQLQWQINNLNGDPVDLTSDDIYLTAFTPGRNPIGVFEVDHSRFTVDTNGLINVTLNSTETMIAQTLDYAIWASPSPDAVIVARGRLEIKPMANTFTPLYSSS